MFKSQAILFHLKFGWFYDFLISRQQFLFGNKKFIASDKKLRLCDFESRPEVEAETGQAVRSHEDEASQYIDTHTIDKVSEMASDQCDQMLE